MVAPLPNFDIDSITTFEDALDAIENSMTTLIEMTEKRVVDPDDKEILSKNVDFVKHFYEKAEFILLNTQ